MKKILCFFLSLVLILSIGGCAQENETPRVPVTFYYRTHEITLNQSEKVISSENREAFGHVEDYQYLIEMYLRGPVTQKCISPFPAGTTLEQLDLLKDKVLIVLSSHISLISGAELTLACVCLGKTISQMTGMDVVRISAKDDLLDGQEFITVTKDDFLLIDSTV